MRDVMPSIASTRRPARWILVVVGAAGACFACTEVSVRTLPQHAGSGVAPQQLAAGGEAVPPGRATDDEHAARLAASALAADGYQYVRLRDELASLSADVTRAAFGRAVADADGRRRAVASAVLHVVLHPAEAATCRRDLEAELARDWYCVLNDRRDFETAAQSPRTFLHVAFAGESSMLVDTTPPHGRLRRTVPPQSELSLMQQAVLREVLTKGGSVLEGRVGVLVAPDAYTTHKPWFAWSRALWKCTEAGDEFAIQEARTVVVDGGQSKERRWAAVNALGNMRRAEFAPILVRAALYTDRTDLELAEECFAAAAFCDLGVAQAALDAVATPAGLNGVRLPITDRTLARLRTMIELQRSR